MEYFIENFIIEKSRICFSRHSFFFFLFRNIIRTTKRNYLFLPDIEIKIASKKKKRGLKDWRNSLTVKKSVSLDYKGQNLNIKGQNYHFLEK